MLAVVKTPHTEICFSGEGSAELLALLHRFYDVQVIDTPRVEQDPEEIIHLNETDWWKNNRYRVLSGVRMRKGLTQKELAEKCGVRPSVISEYESGKRKISPKAAALLGKVLNVRPEKFLV